MSVSRNPVGHTCSTYSAAALYRLLTSVLDSQDKNNCSGRAHHFISPEYLTGRAQPSTPLYYQTESLKKRGGTRALVDAATLPPTQARSRAVKACMEDSPQQDQSSLQFAQEIRTAKASPGCCSNFTRRSHQTLLQTGQLRAVPCQMSALPLPRLLITLF